MHRNHWFDLTPLLDVFLILLFVLLITQQIDEQRIEASYAAEIESLISRNSQMQLLVEEWERQMEADAVEGLEERTKYDFFQTQAVVIDLMIKTEENHLWINNEPTSVYLTSQEDRRESQKSRIKQLLAEELRQQGDSGALLLVTLNADTEAYRYAYRIMQEAAQQWVRERPLPESYVLQIR